MTGLAASDFSTVTIFSATTDEATTSGSTFETGGTPITPGVIISGAISGVLMGS